MAVREKNRSKQSEVRQYSQVQVRFLLGSFQLCSRVFFPRVLVSSKGQPQTKEGGTWRDWVTRVLLGGSSDFTRLLGQKESVRLQVSTWQPQLLGSLG